MKNFTKGAAVSTEAHETHNLNGFFALLYKVDQRNKREEKNRNKKSEKED